MVVEQEPPKPVAKSSTPILSSKIPHQPVFGKPSPLKSNLQADNQVFNIPKHHGTHHRPEGGFVSGLEHVCNNARNIHNPSCSHHASLPKVKSSNFGNVAIPRPTNAPMFNSYPKHTPTFSTVNTDPMTYGAVGGYDYQNPVDLTKPQYPYSADPALHEDHFGAPDPYLYIDPDKANENIKALLEGALEDEEDKPRTRGRKKKVEAVADTLADKMNQLDVNIKAQRQGEESETNEEDAEDGFVEGLSVTLLPHQVAGVEWMREKESSIKKKNRVLPKGGILADDMGLPILAMLRVDLANFRTGLGKTIQSLALMLTNPRPPLSYSASTNIKQTLSASVGKGTLIVAPLALIKQWEAEIKDKVSESHKLRVCVHHGPQRTKRFEDLKKYDVVITTYQILVSEHGSSSKREDGPQFGCFGLHWYRVILDEAHTIKNRNAKASKAAYSLKSEYRWCLTGTPMQNNLDELQSLIRFLKIRPYDDLHVWKDQITRPMSQGRGGIAIKRLQYYLKAFMKRRTKDVLKQEGALNPGGRSDDKAGANDGFKITARKVETVFAEFSPEERGFYDRLEQRTDQSLEQMMDDKKMNYASALTLLLRLRQACNHPRLVDGNTAEDKDTLTTGQVSGRQSPRKAKVADQDIDDVANLLDGLSVQTRQCDTCLKVLSREEMSNSMKRCSECETEFVKLGLGKKSKKSKQRNNPELNKHPMKPSFRKQRRDKRVVDDSGNEEGEGEWIVSEDHRDISDLGRAGGTDNENAKGDGVCLGSSDFESHDESSTRVSSPRDRVISLDGSDEESITKTEDSNDSSSENDDSGNTIKPTPATSAKIRHLIGILKRETPSHKTIVFSQFTSMLDLIEPHLRSSALKYTRYDGSMRNDLREASLNRLRNDRSCRVLLCSLKCGSLGLNLTAASRVIILEPFWNPFVEEQAIDRVHRLNQTKDVVVYKLTVQKTVEERILELQEKKRALANAAIEGKDKVGKLSLKDILNLFGRGAEDDARHDVDVGLEPKTRVLNSYDQMDIRHVGLSEISGRRATPPTMEKGKGGRKEDPVYGRRW